MRLLSKEEQDICLRILSGSGQNNFLGNIIDDKLDGVCITLTRQPSAASLIFTVANQSPTDEETQTFIDRISDLSFFLLSTVKLIELLEKEGYILSMARASQPPQTSTFGRCVGNLPSIGHQFADTEFIGLLIKYFDKELIVTPEFKRFCQRHFIARDEQRFRTQYLVSILALCVTATALLANTFFNLLPKFTGGSKINQHQIDTLATGLKSIENGVDSLSNTMKNVIYYRDSTGQKVSNPPVFQSGRSAKSGRASH